MLTSEREDFACLLCLHLSFSSDVLRSQDLFQELWQSTLCSTGAFEHLEL